MVILFPHALEADDLVAVLTKSIHFIASPNVIETPGCVWSSYFRSHGASVYDFRDPDVI